MKSRLTLSPLIASALLAACTTSAAPTLSPAPTNTISPTSTTPSTTTRTPQPPAPTATITPHPIFETPTKPNLDTDLGFYQLLENNGGCKLPCWWGIEPGVSTWEDVLHQLSSYTFLQFDGEDLLRNLSSQGRKFYSLRFFNVPASFTNPNTGFHSEYRQEDYVNPATNVVDRIRVDTGYDNEHYTVSSLFFAFGPPEDIAIGFKEDTGGDIAYILYIFYPGENV